MTAAALPAPATALSFRADGPGLRFDLDRLIRSRLILTTEEGLAELGPDFETLPTGAALLDHWRGRLPAGERSVLDLVVAAYPDAIPKERIDEGTNYKRSSRDTYLQRLRARQLIEEPSRGAVRASPSLFDGGLAA